HRGGSRLTPGNRTAFDWRLADRLSASATAPFGIRASSRRITGSGHVSPFGPQEIEMKLLEGQTVGIDLGTTYSAIAQLDATGEPVSIPNVDGRKITPSVVLLGEDGHVIVGPNFERIAIEDPSRV